MKPEEHQQLAQQVAIELDRRRSVDEKTHEKHHAYIESLIESDKKRSEIVQNLKKNVLVWFVIGLFVGVWQLFVYWFKNWPPGGTHG